MGKRDIALARYFEDEDRYADLINGFVFRGEPVISGENILDKNTRIVASSKFAFSSNVLSSLLCTSDEPEISL